jgi:uncharacterized protein YecE (DUF72 family)
MRRLREPLEPLANYLASGVLCLKEKLGPILWQFPRTVAFDEDRFKAFFDLLPRDTAELARVAKHHAPFLKKRSHLEPDARRPVRHAVEFRHESFLTDRFTDLLCRHNVALVVADVASKYPTAEDVTADWVYVRLHGSRQLYASDYTPREIDGWAKKVRTWHQGGEPEGSRRIGEKAKRANAGRDVYVFCDNTDVKLRAPVDARRMAVALGVGLGETARQVLDGLSVKPKAKGTRRGK